MSVLCALTLLISVGVGLLLIGCGRGQPPVANAEASKTLYTCGMHPQVIQDKPGNCPICGMKLTPIRKQAGSLGTTNAPASNMGGRKIKYYKSTMNPGEVKPEPGKDSMGMEMVPVYADEAAAAQSQTIEIDSVTIQNMGIRTAAVTRGPLRRGIRTVGTIDYNETAQAEVRQRQ